jgi:electron transport complex protein RnfC
MPCIRCASCAGACPHELQPFELYWFARARNFGKAQEYELFDCIECGCCAYVCPSHIPLVQYIRFAKSEIWSRERDKRNADAAKARYEFRNMREEREKAEKAERLAKAAAARAATPDASADSAAADAEAAKKATIAAAMERARAQRENVQPKNTANLTAAQRREIAEIERRRGQEMDASADSVDDRRFSVNRESAD